MAVVDRYNSMVECLYIYYLIRKHIRGLLEVWPSLAYGACLENKSVRL